MPVNKIYEVAKSCPNKIAIVCNGMKVSYFAFSNGIQQMTSFLGQKNLLPNETAVIVDDMDPSVQWVVVLAMRSLGLNTVVVRSLDQIGTLDLKNYACVVTPENYQSALMAIAGMAAGARHIAIPDKFFQNPPPGLLPFEEFKHHFGGHILYTSGTTGAYKKVMFEGIHEAERNARRANCLLFTKATVWHGTKCGMWTGIGFRNPPAIWSNGGCVVLDRRVDWYKYFLSHGVNSATLTPQILKELLEFRGNSAMPNNELTISVGGGFVSLNLANEVMRKLTSDLRISYGNTEVEGPILRSTFKSTADLFWYRPVPGKHVQVVDDSGAECSFGQEGELRIVLSEIDGQSYMDDKTTSAKFFRDGCFYPGDMATMREDGCIRILGRATDVINIQGTKTVVAPIEESIQRMLGVDEVCVFSGLSKKGSEVLSIAIESKEQLSNEALKIVGSKFSQFEKVSIFTFREFPRTEGGMNKVNRRILKNQIFDKLDSRDI